RPGHRRRRGPRVRGASDVRRAGRDRPGHPGAVRPWDGRCAGAGRPVLGSRFVRRVDRRGTGVVTGMTRTTAHDFALALRHYLSGAEEAARLQAYQAARDAMGRGVGLLEVIAEHQEALAIVLSGPRRPDDSSGAVNASGELLKESLAPFEMAHRGYQEANAALLRANRDLEGQV